MGPIDSSQAPYISQQTKDLLAISARGAEAIFSPPRERSACILQTANLRFLCTNKKIPRVKLKFLKTFFCTKNAIFLLYCDSLNCSLRSNVVKYGNQCILHEKKGFQNIILTLSIFLLVHRAFKSTVCTLISLLVMRK